MTVTVIRHSVWCYVRLEERAGREKGLTEYKSNLR